METKKCMDCKYHITHYNPSIKILGKPMHGICSKYNESLTFTEACYEYEEKKKQDSHPLQNP